MKYRIEDCVTNEHTDIDAENVDLAALFYALEYRTVNGDDEPAARGTIFGEFRVCEGDDVLATFHVVADGFGRVRSMGRDWGGEDCLFQSITNRLADFRIAQVAEILADTVLGGSIMECVTGRGEDNAVLLQVRHSDMESLYRLKAIIDSAEAHCRISCMKHGWGLLESHHDDVQLIGHLKTHAREPCDGHPLNEGSRMVTYQTWHDCWLECIEPLDLDR